MKAIDLIMSNTYFYFNNKFHKKIFADLVMGILEEVLYIN